LSLSSSSSSSSSFLPPSPLTRRSKQQSSVRRLRKSVTVLARSACIVTGTSVAGALLFEIRTFDIGYLSESEAVRSTTGIFLQVLRRILSVF
jgi:hypothetical protein